MQRHRWLSGRITAVAVALALLGCNTDQQSLAPKPLKQGDVLIDIVTALSQTSVTAGYMIVCKDAPAGSPTGTFTVRADYKFPGGPEGNVTSTLTASGVDGQCRWIFQGESDPGFWVWEPADGIPANWHLAGATVYTTNGAPVELTPAQLGDMRNILLPNCYVDLQLGCMVVVHNVPDGVCLDAGATNMGGPLPCVYPPQITPCPAGSFTFTLLPNGDLAIKYDQFPAPNDNSYGVNAVGWPNGHKFGDLVGSDHAGVQLVDPNGIVRLSFNIDYISANASAPSGYKSMGVTGGEGKMLVGTADGITATTSLDNNLNGVNIPGLFNAAHVQQFGSVNVLINSPPTDAAHQSYIGSDPTLAGWDFHDTYFATISAAKLASIGFNINTWKVEPNLSQLHNSPAKPCPPAPPSASSLSTIKYEVKDKQVKITIQNSSSSDLFVTALNINWPSAVNGKLMQIKLDGDVMYDNPDIPTGPASLSAQLVADQNKRKINHNSSDVYTLIFEKNADPDLSHYAGNVTISGIVLTVLPH